jgi:dihydropteroate synthase
MPRYSFRKLQLTTRRDLMAEFTPLAAGEAEKLFTYFSKFPATLKIIARESEISTNLLSALTRHGMACHPATSTSVYLFSDIEALQTFTQNHQYHSADEEIFVTALHQFLQRQQREEFTIPTKSNLLHLGGRTLIMGVLNCTPDSFYDGGRYFSHEVAITYGLHLAEAGADIIDVGGESTRPKDVYGEGAEPVSTEEELRRVIPVIEVLAKRVNIPISIDTYKAPVAEAAIHAGASIVNDISGFQFDNRMPEVVTRLGVPVVLMHIKGTPRNMQENPTYENLMDELYLYLERQIEAARCAGIAEERIIIDPGLGFGKRLSDNYEILRRLAEFRGLGCPILVGPSRKSFVGKALNLPPDQRLEGTAAALALAVSNGAHIVRVHDVTEMRRVAMIADLIAGRTEAG